MALNPSRSQQLVQKKLACLSTNAYCYCSLFYAFPKGLFKFIIIWTKFSSARSGFFTQYAWDWVIGMQSMNICLSLPKPVIIIVIIQENQQLELWTTNVVLNWHFFIIGVLCRIFFQSQNFSTTVFSLKKGPFAFFFRGREANGWNGLICKCRLKCLLFNYFLKTCELYGGSAPDSPHPFMDHTVFACGIL